MKNKKIFYLLSLLLVILMVFCILNINSYAVTLPELMITSNNYSDGDKMKYDDIEDIEVKETLQLYAVIAFGNEMLIDGDYDSLGRFVDEANLSGITWTSSNTDIVTVDNKGKVKGISEGTATITAQYDIGSGNHEEATYEITVSSRSKSNSMLITIVSIAVIIIILAAVIIYIKIIKK